MTIKLVKARVLNGIFKMVAADSKSPAMSFSRNWVLSWTDKIPIANQAQVKVLRKFGVPVEDCEDDDGSMSAYAFVDHDVYFDDTGVSRALRRLKRILGARNTYCASLALVLEDSEK